MNISLKQKRKIRRNIRTRAKIFGSTDRPRLSVFRSLSHIYAQIIDDNKGQTLVEANDLELKKNKVEKGEDHLKGKIALAHRVGMLLAERAIQKNIKKVVFDRGSFLYHGRVEALAEGARKGGLEF
jgi:large subunit ribosomal protein L18